MPFENVLTTDAIVKNFDERIGTSDYLIGGSYIVDKTTANDLDLIMNEYTYVGDIKDNLAKEGYLPVINGDPKYNDIDRDRIVEVLEGRLYGVKVNIIVVGSVYWPAYVGAIIRMRLSPELYGTREKRVELHKDLCKQAKAIANPEYDLPEF